MTSPAAACKKFGGARQRAVGEQARCGAARVEGSQRRERGSELRRTSHRRLARDGRRRRVRRARRRGGRRRDRHDAVRRGGAPGEEAHEPRGPRQGGARRPQGPPGARRRLFGELRGRGAAPDGAAELPARRPAQRAEPPGRRQPALRLREVERPPGPLRRESGGDARRALGDVARRREGARPEVEATLRLRGGAGPRLGPRRRPRRVSRDCEPSVTDARPRPSSSGPSSRTTTRSGATTSSARSR